MNNTTTENASSLLPRNWQLPQIFHDRLGNHAGAQRAMFHDGHLLLILHDVPESGVQTRQGLFFWRDPSGRWRSTVGAGFVSLTHLVDRYETRIDLLEARLEIARDATTLFDVLRQGSPLRRTVSNLARALQQAREALGGRDMIAQRDRAQEMATACDMLITDAKHALDYAMARQAEAQAEADRQQAENSARLNRLAAMFLPLTLLASLFGMKLPSGLETNNPLAFWVIVVGGLGVGFVIGRFNGPRGGAVQSGTAVKGGTAVEGGTVVPSRTAAQRALAA